MRIGFGFDSHRLQAGSRLVLGGVEIDASFGTVAHSDGDALVHAVIDALFGAAALKDIGSHFPPSDPAYADADSRRLLEQAVTLLVEHAYTTTNVDCTIILEQPAVSPYIDAMRHNLAHDLRVHETAVSVKAKTKEGSDAAGRGEVVEVYAVAMIEEIGSEAWV